MNKYYYLEPYQITNLVKLKLSYYRKPIIPNNEFLLCLSHPDPELQNPTNYSYNSPYSVPSSLLQSPLPELQLKQCMTCSRLLAVCGRDN